MQDKLTVADVEALLVHGVNGVIEERAHDLARQLAQVMRENERLKARMNAAEKYIAESPCDPDIYPTQWEAYRQWKALTGDERYKDTNHIVDPNKMVPGDHSEHILELVPDAGNATKDTEEP